MHVPSPDLVSPELSERLHDLQPYYLVLLWKGRNYDAVESARIIDAEHLPYLYRLRDAGIVVLSLPVISDARCRAVALYNLTDAQAVHQHVSADPAVQAGIFEFEILPVLGVPGDHLPPR